MLATVSGSRPWIIIIIALAILVWVDRAIAERKPDKQRYRFTIREIFELTLVLGVVFSLGGFYMYILDRHGHAELWPVTIRVSAAVLATIPCLLAQSAKKSVHEKSFALLCLGLLYCLLFSGDEQAIVYLAPFCTWVCLSASRGINPIQLLTILIYGTGIAVAVSSFGHPRGYYSHLLDFSEGAALAMVPAALIYGIARPLWAEYAPEVYSAALAMLAHQAIWYSATP